MLESIYAMHRENVESRCRHRARAPQAFFACPTVSIRKFNSRNSSVVRDEVGVERKFLQFSRWQGGGVAGRQGRRRQSDGFEKSVFANVQVTPELYSPGLGRRPFSSRVKNRHRKILRGSPRRPGVLATKTTTTTTWIRNIYDVSALAVNIWTRRWRIYIVIKWRYQRVDRIPLFCWIIR